METLVLSHAYLPLDRVRWERAVALWIMDKVEILEEYEDREIHSTSLVIKEIRVVVLPLPAGPVAKKSP